MRTLVLLLLGFTLVLSAKPYKNPQNFSQAKNLMNMIHFDYNKSWLKECSYKFDVTSCMTRMIVDKNCSGGRKVSIKWTHAIPASFYGRQFACMNEPMCSKYNGEKYGGERCCRMTNNKYLQMEADLQNIVPLLSNRKKIPLLESVTEKKKGDLARIYLYFNEQYGINLDYEQQIMFYKWHKKDPPDEQECALYKQIKKVQHKTNRLLEQGCLEQ